MHRRHDSLRRGRLEGCLPVRENATAKHETKTLPVVGEKHGPSCAVWCFGVHTTMEQVREEVNLVVEWVDSLDSLGTKDQHVLDMQWALKQLYVLTLQLTGQVKEFTLVETGKGIIRGATTADPRSGDDPESETGAVGCCVTHQEGKQVRRACGAAASLAKDGSRAGKVHSVRTQ